MATVTRRRPLRSTRATRQLLGFVVLFVLGIAVGMYLGWEVAPVPVANTTLGTLNQLYRDDYLLMTATAYARTHDLDTAAARLKLLNVGGSAVAGTFERITAEADRRALAELAAALNATTPAMQPYLP